MLQTESLAETFSRRADAPFLIAPGGEALSYGQAAGQIAGLKEALAIRGLVPGDRLAIAASNSLQLALLMLAALDAGLVVVPLGSGFGARELRLILDRSRPRVVVVSDDRDERIAQLAGEAGIELLILVESLVGEPVADARPFETFDAARLAAIHFTSGTTGVPRGVGHRAGDFLGNARRFAAANGLSHENRFYATLPMTYMAGYYNLLLLPASIGGSVVIGRSFDARSVLSYWQPAIECDANSLWLVPTIAAMLLKVDRGDEGRSFCRERVRFAAIGTAPLDAELRASFELEYGVALHESYGLSETLLATSSTPTDPTPSGAVGTPLPGVDVRLDERGAVLIASPDTMVGYLTGIGSGGPEFDDPTRDGWFDTGDLGAWDNRHLRIVGRVKDIIIRGGVNVSAVEVERVLRSHPDVDEVAVVGIPHELLGEAVAAVVVTRGSDLASAEQALRALARAELETAQQPDVYIQIDAFPSTATGKVRKGTLRDQVIDRLGLPAERKGFTIDEDTGADRATSIGVVHDLTHPIHEGMVTFASPNHPRVRVEQLARIEETGRETRRIEIGSHTGTHYDAPRHFVAGGATIDEYDMDTFVGPAVVADLTPVAPLEEVSLDRLRAALGGAPRHPRVLLRFDWDTRYVDGDFYAQSPYLARGAAAWLLESGIRLLGMDTPSPDDPRLGFGSDDDSPNHHTLLGGGVVLLEYLANLRALPPVVFLVAAPLQIAGSDGSPVRALAFEIP
jgi:acyl-CoA synthetase (AMP-forming)/AMP-acid ligase II/kynurenine formamidase